MLQSWRQPHCRPRDNLVADLIEDLLLTFGWQPPATVHVGDEFALPIGEDRGPFDCLRDRLTRGARQCPELWQGRVAQPRQLLLPFRFSTCSCSFSARRTRVASVATRSPSSSCGQVSPASFNMRTTRRAALSRSPAWSEPSMPRTITSRLRPSILG